MRRAGRPPGWRLSLFSGMAELDLTLKIQESNKLERCMQHLRLVNLAGGLLEQVQNRGSAVEQEFCSRLAQDLDAGGHVAKRKVTSLPCSSLPYSLVLAKDPHLFLVTPLY